MQTKISILKVNPARSGVSAKTNKPWTMQDCECMTINDDGSIGQVGVLQLPRDMVGELAPKAGDYVATFGLQPNMQTRRIEAQIVALVPHIAAKSAPAALK